jgi:hypothetical protein
MRKRLEELNGSPQPSSLKDEVLQNAVEVFDSRRPGEGASSPSTSLKQQVENVV